MNHLYRELAPICADAWEAIDDEARRALKVTLAARKVADFVGPGGWAAGSVDLGRTTSISDAPAPGVSGGLRTVQPLVELRATFELARSELDAVARGAKDPDLDAVRKAARSIAYAEDRAAFHGYAAAGIQGVFQAAANETLTITEDYEAYPGVVARALAKLRTAGVDGPYAIALGPRCYTGLTQTTTKGGYPVIQHVQRLLDGPVVWAPAVDGAAVLSLRGGDFELTIGGDFAIGYSRHTSDIVELYIEESFTFRVLAAEAAIPLAYGDAKQASA